MDEKSWPKRVYWDKVGSITAAETIHYQDVASLRGFHCPDMSHLDYRDAPRFTEAFLDELVQIGVLQE
ncbi:MAG: hypothetical protein HQ582_15785 [Planctomycetes bacterium]|nr:hypothetical protein [Planctomycetota bacterium]